MVSANNKTQVETNNTKVKYQILVLLWLHSKFPAVINIPRNTRHVLGVAQNGNCCVLQSWRNICGNNFDLKSFEALHTNKKRISSATQHKKHRQMGQLNSGICVI